MPIDIEKLVQKQRPSLIVFESISEAESEVRKLIQSGLLEKIKFSAIDNSEQRKQKLAVALQSIVFLIAEDVSQNDSKLEGMIHLKRKDFEQAVGALTLLTEDPLAITNLTSEWEATVSKFLRAELKETPRREAIFRTCDQFKIDLPDFEKVFSPDQLDNITAVGQ